MKRTGEKRACRERLDTEPLTFRAETTKGEDADQDRLLVPASVPRSVRIVGGGRARPRAQRIGERRGHRR
jgi:hypothetical protein